MITLAVGTALVIWLVLSFIDLPMDNPHEFDAVKFWNQKEQKWMGMPTVELVDIEKWDEISKQVLKENESAWIKLAKE